MSDLPNVLLAGCGDIACRLANLLQDRYRLSGLRRQPAGLPTPIEPIAADLCDRAAVAQALAGRHFDYVVITLTPGDRTEQRYRAVYVDGTGHLLSALARQTKVLFVSSTSVYGQDAGEAVDETSAAFGSGFSGRVLCEAEQRVLDSGLPATLVRFSGIYGPGRERLLRLVREGKVDVGGAAQWTNRIHADDCARVLAFLLDRWQSGISPQRCYVASDTRPVQAGEVWQWLAAELGQADPLAGIDWRRQAASGKRCDSTLLQREGFRYLYPDYQSGYRSLLSGKNQQP